MMVRWFHKRAITRLAMEGAQLDEPTSGVQEVLVPERVVDALPPMYCFETCPFCFKVKAILGSRGMDLSLIHI